jgi:succinyl-CoA synthetase beta subunit
LSGLFLGVLGLIAVPALVFSVRYLRPSASGRTVGALTAVFVLALALVLCARDPLTFLLGWETMTLVPAVVILVSRGAHRRARQTVFSYLAVTQAGAKAARVMDSVYTAFRGTDASLVEINPLVLTAGGDVLALDAKMNFDDSALFRHPDLRELRDLDEEDPLEIDASKYSLNYIRLDGTIGCMVNGAGLAMATMDIIKLAGGEPANFLDVGGGASAEQIKNAFRILTADRHVRAVFINIFGGILRCDILAEGLVAAVRELGVRLPIVIRMEGTNVAEGKRMLRESGLDFTTADTMDQGAREVVALAAR